MSQIIARSCHYQPTEKIVFERKTVCILHVFPVVTAMAADPGR